MTEDKEYFELEKYAKTAKNNSELDEYFVWTPDKKNKDNPNYDENGTKVVYFNLDLENVNLNSERHMWRSVKGLAGILIKDNSKDKSSNSKLYNVKFNGKIKRAIDSSEKDQIINDYHREVSREGMRKLRDERGEVYMDKHKYFFPVEEFGTKLDSFLGEYNSSEIEEEKIKNILKDILGEKNSLEPQQAYKLCNNPRWVRLINNILGKKDYAKEGDKYVKIQK